MPMTDDPTARAKLNFNLFLAANVLLGIAACVDSSTFNNYLRETFHLTVAQRTFLEFPRETPGFLVMAFFGVLAGLGDIRIAAIANVTAGVGMLALGFIPPVYFIMVISVFVYSSGQHVYMPLSNSIGMSFAKSGGEGLTLGKIAGANTAALVTGSFILMGLYAFAGLKFAQAYMIGAAALIGSGVLIFMMRPPREKKARVRFVARKEYSLFYGLSVLYGARKQLFITFGPWIIVDTFKQPVTTMTFLFFIVSVSGIFLKPLVGKLIDTVGSKTVLGIEALIIVLTCLVYAFAPEILPPGAALIAVCAAYVVDQSGNAVGMARSVYLKKIAVKPEDVAPTLSLGISIDHIVSMSIPILGGLAWNAGNSGYRVVFLFGAGVSLANFVVTRFMVSRE